LFSKYFKKHGWRYLPGLVFLILSSYIASLAPMALGDAIDALSVPDPAKSDVMRCGLNIVLIAVGVFVTRFTWRYFIIGGARIMENLMREELFIKFQSLQSSFYTGQRSGDLMAYAVNDIGAVRMTFGPLLAMSINGISTAIIVLYQMVSEVDAKMTMLAMIPVPIAIVLMILLGKRIQKLSRRVQALFSNVSGVVNETIMGAKVVKSFAKEVEQEAQFAEASNEMREANIKLTRASSLMGPMVNVVFGACYAISLIVGGNMVLNGEISVGTLVTFNGYILLIQNPVASIGRIIRMLQRGLASLKRLNAIFEQPGIPEWEMDRSRKLDINSIEVKDLTFLYFDSGKPKLRNINFKLKKGQTLGIVGPTGSGKSTIARLLLKLYMPPKGTIFINGEDICKIPAYSVRAASGYVPQDGFLFSASIKDNIIFYQPGAGEKEMEEAAKNAHIYKEIASLPNAFDTQVGERGAHLSGGQKQRIALARALIRDPELLILDDTLSAVDNHTEVAILGNLDKYMKGRTSIIISHRLSAIRHADLILYMDDGAVAERGTHDELMALNGAYAEMYRSQEQGGDFDDE